MPIDVYISSFDSCTVEEPNLNYFQIVQKFDGNNVYPMKIIIAYPKYTYSEKKSILITYYRLIKLLF